MLEGVLWLLAQFIHIHFSLGAFLILSNDLQGSIVINRETGQVINYQDFGGGITALFTVILITGVVWAVIRAGWSSNRPRAMMVHFLIVFSIKTALIWSIYFSGNIDPRILAKFSLQLWHFIPDLAAMILAILVLTLFPGEEPPRSESPDREA